MHEVIMPKLGITMESGRIEKWHKKEGDKVEAGEVLFEVMTDKVTIEVESYNSGILKKILRDEGEEVPVTGIVAYIGEEDEEIPADKLEEAKPEKTSEINAQKVEGKAAGTGKSAAVSGKRVKISPLARRTAEELGIDYRLEKIKGSGPGGRIEKKDIMSYSSQLKEPESGEEKTPGKGIAVKSSIKLSGMRKITAERMSFSKTNIPHIVLNIEANVTELTGFKKELEEKLLKKHKVKITYTDLILKSAAAALRINQELNSTYSDGSHIIYDDINVGLAVSLEDGLVVPVIKTCDRLSIENIAKRRIEITGRAREGKLSPEDVSGGTFTVTNLGMYGVRSFSPIINPPQAAVLAVGEIYTGPVVTNGKTGQGYFMNLSISCDHRIIDGKNGAKFLKSMKELLENPSKLNN
jgi:pyruvate dehydrogenase E2 component (dihydrolipoamide acetyltransferase)